MVNFLLHALLQKYRLLFLQLYFCSDYNYDICYFFLLITKKIYINEDAITVIKSQEPCLSKTIKTFFFTL